MTVFTSGSASPATTVRVSVADEHAPGASVASNEPLMSPKSEAGKGYVQALDMLKANAVALGRWAPAMVQDLKRAQARLTDVLNVNMAVLATARSVSEGIVRSLATEVAAPRTLTTYGAGGRAMTPPRSSATPLTISRSL